MAIRSEKNKKLVDDLEAELEAMKFKVKLSKAYPRLLKNTARKVWLLSHEDKFQFIDEIKHKVDKGGIVSFFSMTKYIRLEDLKKEKIEKLD